MKVCLVGSSGGHLTHLWMLKPFWKDKERFWVTFDKQDARSMLKEERMYPCYYPTNRNIKNLLKIFSGKKTWCSAADINGINFLYLMFCQTKRKFITKGIYITI